MGVCFTLHIFDQTQCPGCGDQRPGQCQQIHHGLCLLPMFKQLLKAEFDRWATGKLYYKIYQQIIFNTIIQSIREQIFVRICNM